ncbi:MAG: insulinase family protein [Bacteroidota bacterium]|nr:insulinase family protein [Bacteroidota bacterium]
MRNLKIFPVLFLAGFIMSGAIAQKINPNDPVPPDPNIRIGKMANGFTYYVKQNKKPEQRMELRLAVNAGSICETEAQQGLAHFCEHMCFNGTKNFPSNKMIDMLEEMGVKFGADVNASTGFDQTVYMLEIPTDKMEWIDRGFQVLEDWTHQVDFDAKEIDKERGVIIEEWRLGLGADDRMMQKYLPVLFRGSRYAERLPIGKIDVIKSFPYDTLREFYKEWYRPDLMSVVVVGDIDPNLAEEKIKEHFSMIPEPVNPEKRVEYPVPDNSEPLISVVTDKEATGFDAQILFKHPKAESVTYADYREYLMRMIYTGMLNSRLQEIVRKPDAPFLYASAGYGPFIGRTIDVYSLSVSAKENQIEKSIVTILTENERARRFGFTESELAREKKDLYTMYENGAKEADKTPSSEYADEFIRNYLTQECIPGYQKEFDMVKDFLPGITLDEINKMGQPWTTDNNMLVLITAQQKEGVEVPDEQKVREILTSAKTEKIEPYVDKVSDAPLLPEQPGPSPVTQKAENSEFGYTELTFSNGVHMILKPTDFKNDEILFSAYSPGGTSLYPDNDILSATLAPAIITQSGLGNYNYTDLQKKLSGNTAKVSPYISELREGINGNCSPKDFETMLQLNYLFFTGIRKDESAFNSYISRMKNMVKPLRANPQYLFSDTLSKIVSMNSPRVIAIPTEAQLDKVSLDRVLTIFRDRFADASDFTYFMVGNFKVSEVIPLLEKYIGSLPSKRRIETWRDVTPGFPKGLVKVDVPKNSEPQSMVAMVWKGDFKWKDRYRMGFRMLMDILSIKCRESMREEQGGVYGVNITGNAVKFPKPKYTITTFWGCNPDSINTLTATVLNEMDKIRKDGPTEVDLNKVKETLIRERETRSKENSFWVSALQNHFLEGDRLLTLDEYKNYVNSFAAKEIKDVADRYLNTKSYVEVDLTPAPKQ